MKVNDVIKMIMDDSERCNKATGVILGNLKLSKGLIGHTNWKPKAPKGDPLSLRTLCIELGASDSWFAIKKMGVGLAPGEMAVAAIAKKWVDDHLKGKKLSYPQVQLPTFISQIETKKLISLIKRPNYYYQMSQLDADTVDILVKHNITSKQSFTELCRLLTPFKSFYSLPPLVYASAMYLFQLQLLK